MAVSSNLLDRWFLCGVKEGPIDLGNAIIRGFSMPTPIIYRPTLHIGTIVLAKCNALSIAAVTTFSGMKVIFFAKSPISTQGTPTINESPGL